MDKVEQISPRQQRFAMQYCLHLNGSRAAREAGYSAASGADAVTACRLLGLNKVQAAIQALQQAKAEELDLTRQDVIRAILGAIKAAQKIGKPAIEIRGWHEIARLCGFGVPEAHHAGAPLSASADLIRRKLEAMPTSQLLEIAARKRELMRAPGTIAP